MIRTGDDTIANLRDARDLMDRCFRDETLSLERIAAAALMSKSHFVRVFTRQYGLTPGAYLTRRRIERARDLLRFANLSVTEVCHDVGFSSLGSFSTTFRRHVGENPSAYQRRWRAQGGPRVPGCEMPDGYADRRRRRSSNAGEASVATSCLASPA